MNRKELVRRVSKIALYQGRIQIANSDAIVFLSDQVASLDKKHKPFVYLDPPYYAKGRDLYLNYYSRDDHAALARYMANQTKYPWFMSYDNVREIARLYVELRQVRFSLDYSARERREGSELMIFRREMKFPTAWVRSIPRRFITAAEDAPRLPAM